jgi:SAM-dependent methyltransferase
LASIYDFPKYYDIAFSYRDTAREAAVMQAAIELFSHIPVQKALEIACGHSPHLEHILRLGYEYHGLDLSTSMLDYAEAKAAALGFSAKLFQADLADFTLPEPVDFAYIMLGSLYVQTTEQLLSHFASVERALKPGGLYFLDWCIDFSPLTNTRDAWSCRRNGVEVKVRYTTKLLHPARQHYEESLYADVRDGKHRLHLSHSNIRRAIYPQEFMLAATHLHRFELVGWWNDWDFSAPLDQVTHGIVRPITILRRL